MISMQPIYHTTDCRYDQLTTSNCRSTTYRIPHFSFILLTKKLNSQYCSYYITLTKKIYRSVIVCSLFSKTRIKAEKCSNRQWVFTFICFDNLF